MMKHILLAVGMAALFSLVGARDASAHQPYFEETDLTDHAPYVIQNPEISLAYYATLDAANDVDYYTFAGKAGERILLELTIPQIAGQENFAPTLALLGPGLSDAPLPQTVVRAKGAGALILNPPANARAFYEPFSGTSYWERQKEVVTLPENGKYNVAVWHPQGTVGRYVFVTGTREVFGGDMTFPIKMRDYWTPVTAAPRALSWFEKLWSGFTR
jgi:hypothetical protein